MKKFLVTEKDMRNIISILIENVNHFGSDDFKDLFYRTLRRYVEEKYDVNLPKNVSVTYLENKFMKQFLDDIGYEYDESRYYQTSARIVDVGKFLIKSGIVEIPNLTPEIKFTEKFRRPLEKIVSMLEIPNTVQVSISEPNPYNVNIKFDVPNFDEFLKGPKFNPKDTFYKLRDLLSQFLSVEFGNPEEGFLRINNIGLDRADGETWVKDTFNKKIKPFLKNEIGKDYVKSISLEWDERNGMKIKLTIPNVREYQSWRDISRKKKAELEDKIQLATNNFYRQFGYNDDIVKITNNL